MGSDFSDPFVQKEQPHWPLYSFTMSYSYYRGINTNTDVLCACKKDQISAFSQFLCNPELFDSHSGRRLTLREINHTADLSYSEEWLFM